MNHAPRILTIAVGNTRTRAGLFDGGQLLESVVFQGSDPNHGRQSLERLITEGQAPEMAAIASVNDSVAERVGDLVRELLPDTCLARVGRDLDMPIRHTLDDPSTVGHDRWLNAIGAFSRTRQACVIVDVGTAVTVDFVDGEGVFHGGVIFPGLNMMLRALHEGTAALPELTFAMPDRSRGALGKDTAHAMMLGAIVAVRGGVRTQLEQCAHLYGAYPQIIATGGDAAILEEEGLIEHFVPDLQLIGMHVCVMHAAGEDAESTDE
ncbi:MAG: type III pantothenate kinase [Planctomycetota bacterium]|nr:MAG: type III pantothenate kinase [Planctomycetota bacterium]